MIENKDLAAQVNEKLLSANRSIIDALKLIEERGSAKEVQTFRVEAANVAGHLFALLLRPLWQAHPELAPEGLDMGQPSRKRGRR
ncbi:hypothetical protein P3T42_004587 [Paraburkholderia sp. GAS38]|jgi:hypothetical protein|uniref:hypothetical protein n=1 Tax=Paraburkholderia sp. GAS38 TaxID=3035133 RepID=UPI003D23567A